MCRASPNRPPRWRAPLIWSVLTRSDDRAGASEARHRFSARGQAQRGPVRPPAASTAYIHLQIMKHPCFVSQYGAFVAIGGRNVTTRSDDRAAAPGAWAVGRPRAAFAFRLSCPGLLCCGPSGRPRRALWHGKRASGVRGQAKRDTAFPRGDKRSAAPSGPGSTAPI